MPCEHGCENADYCPKCQVESLIPWYEERIEELTKVMDRLLKGGSIRVLLDGTFQYPNGAQVFSKDGKVYFDVKLMDLNCGGELINGKFTLE